MSGADGCAICGDHYGGTPFDLGHCSMCHDSADEAAS